MLTALAILPICVGQESNTFAQPPSTEASNEFRLPIVPSASLQPAIENAHANLSVTYQEGQLAVMAHNVPLSDVLKAVSSHTGTQIDFPPDSANDVVFVEIKPSKISDVLAVLLEGTNLNYVVVTSSRTDGGAKRVIITERVNSALPDDPRTSKTASVAGPGHEVLYQQLFRVDPKDDSQAGSNGSVAADYQEGQSPAGADSTLSDRAKMINELQKRQIQELEEKAAQAQQK